LPGEQHSRGDLLEVASDFHRGEPLKWLFRDSTVFEQEVFFVLALEAHWADGLFDVLREGVRPWWQRTRGVSAKCREARQIEFGESPEGFWADGGWWEDASGVISAIPAQSNDKWTRAKTETLMGTVDEVVLVMLPSGVSSISGDAFKGYATLRSLTIQPGCSAVDDGSIIYDGRGFAIGAKGALAGCVSLVRVTFPDTCASVGKCALYGCANLVHVTFPSSLKNIGEYAFRDCSGLTHVTIPPSVTNIGFAAFFRCSGLTDVTIRSSVTSIGEYAFYNCTSLRRLTMHANIAEIGVWYREAFAGVTSLERVTLIGSPLNAAVVNNVVPALAPGAKVVGRALAGQRFGRLTICAAP
jgi:hypothetical protein